MMTDNTNNPSEEIKNSAGASSDIDARRNCDILFEYLRCILYEPESARLDIGDLDEDYRKLGQGLQYLEKAVDEMKSCSAALAKGNLSEFAPKPGNLLCDNLKGIYSNMLHLTWQAKQVAQGNYSQDMSYLGDFFDAFNHMTAQLREREEQLVGEALYDPLTQLGNRYYFKNRMDNLARNGQEIALCYCDLDGLKYVNDTFGHAEGDAYIKEFADLLRKNTRGGDILARMGGDEFCIVLDECSVESAQRRMTIIQNKFAATQSSGCRYDRCASFGVVPLPATGDWETAMKQADEYMYQQKSEHKHHR